MELDPQQTPAEFAHKRRGVCAGERQAAQADFLDLGRMLGEPELLDADPSGRRCAFERGAERSGGGGFADVWRRDFFAWEC